ncbi:MAG: hypothetical protein M1834_005035 [Cirrosporium novae-zelandiae]|nr:MAG: hypothetical protein M1834_005035 [Cirrosporium novae-zelandiae]
MSPHIVLAFDVYGTLLLTSSMAEKLAEYFGDEKAAKVAADWRMLQLEYTWRWNSMEKYTSYSTITRSSLHHALSLSNLTLSPTATDALMTNYNSLSRFPDVSPAFSALRTTITTTSPNDQHPITITPVIFSNGPISMLQAYLSSPPSLAPHADIFKKLISVDEMPEGEKRYKPHPSVYEHLVKEMEVERGDVWLISGNPFDIVGANMYGLRTCWVDREGKGWVDRSVVEVEGKGRPDLIVHSLSDMVGRVTEWVEGKGKGGEGGRV